MTALLAPDFTQRLNMTVPWFLMASYAYYHLDKEIMSDGEFDQLCVLMKANWDSIDHMHKHLIDMGMLEAGTGYNIKFPVRIKNATEALIDAQEIEEILS